MSTTVTYKGSTLTTADNQTKTLKTAGKYMEDDVTIVDAVPSGTAGTPIATKGTVSNHSVSITPSVTNTTGYITGGTKTGTAVTVSASELVSGTYTVDSSGTKDVTNYASASVASGTAGTPSASKGSVSNHSIAITPSVTNTTGWITGSTKTGTAVTVSASELVSGSETKNSNGVYDVTNLAELVVDVSGGTIVIEDTTDSHGGTIREITATEAVYLQNNKSVTPTESTQTITPDTGYDALSSVSVGAISSTYVGSGISRKSSSDLTASGATVTVPAGYYSSQATKSVSSMTLPTSASSSATSGYTSKATISRSTSDQYINIPTGYNSSGAYYKVNATANGSVTAPSSISGTSASVSTGTNTITLSKTVSVTPNVTTAGYISSGTAGNASVSLTASVNTRTSSNLTVSGATVTAPAGYYASDASKSVSTMTLPTSATSSATSGYTSKATINRSTSDQYINIPTGYNSSGAYYKVSATANGTVTAPSSISGTSATLGYSASGGYITLSKTISVTPNVTTAGYISAGTAGNSSVSLTTNVDIRSSSDLSVSGNTVTAPAGYYPSSASINVSGGDGFVYEMGTWTPSEDISATTGHIIQFANTHSEAPFFYMIANSKNNYSSSLTNTMHMLEYMNFDQALGVTFYTSSTSALKAQVNLRFRPNSSTMSSGTMGMTYPYTDTGNTSSSYSRFWATESGIKAYYSVGDYYWRSSVTYKWIAIFRA